MNDGTCLRAAALPIEGRILALKNTCLIWRTHMNIFYIIGVVVVAVVVAGFLGIHV